MSSAGPEPTSNRRRRPDDSIANTRIKCYAKDPYDAQGTTPRRLFVRSNADTLDIQELEDLEAQASGFSNSEHTAGDATRTTRPLPRSSVSVLFLSSGFD